MPKKKRFGKMKNRTKPVVLVGFFFLTARFCSAFRGADATGCAVCPEGTFSEELPADDDGKPKLKVVFRHVSVLVWMFHFVLN